MKKTERHQNKLLVSKSQNEKSVSVSNEYEIIIFMTLLILSNDYDNKSIS